jgi:RNA polymerase sigma-70 factor, ECF subfamily
MRDNCDMDSEIDQSGKFEARYLAFLETITHLRQKLHRYCSRMVGSVLDGEDVVQEALFQAYRKLDTFDDNRPLRPWLFRIAHNRCIDFLRRRGIRIEAETAAATQDYVEPLDPPGPALGHAVERLVLNLPPMERACVLLKDVLDYTLQEIAELVDSTVGGVKAALNRGRSKLASLPEQSISLKPPTAEATKIMRLYVERFNQRDWNGLRELIADDAQLRVADRFAGRLSKSPYFGVYERWPVPLRLALGELDGESVVIIMQLDAERWRPQSCVRMEVLDERIVRVADYFHCPWILTAADSLNITAPS